MGLARVFLTVIFLGTLIAFHTTSALAEQELKVTVSPGNSSDYTSDITLEDLQSGKMEYMISGMGKSYKVKLSEEQIKDVLGGTTVMVDSMGDGGSNIRVGVTVEGQPESSGW